MGSGKKCIKTAESRKDRERKSLKERAKPDSKERGKRRGGKEQRRMEAEFLADEDGALVVGSGIWSALTRLSRSTSKKPSKNESERMAADGALVAEGKNAEENEGSSLPGRTSGQRQGERRCARVPGGLWAMGNALIFLWKIHSQRVLVSVYSGGVGWGREAGDVCNQRRA